jgi:hypothetical protein
LEHRGSHCLPSGTRHLLRDQEIDDLMEFLEEMDEVEE